MEQRTLTPVERLERIQLALAGMALAARKALREGEPMDLNRLYTDAAAMAAGIGVVLDEIDEPLVILEEEPMNDPQDDVETNFTATVTLTLTVSGSASGPRVLTVDEVKDVLRYRADWSAWHDNVDDVDVDDVEVDDIEVEGA